TAPCRRSVVAGRCSRARARRDRVGWPCREARRTRPGRPSGVGGGGREPARIAGRESRREDRVMGTLRLYMLVLRRMRPYVGVLVLSIVEVLLMAALEILKPWPIKIVIDNVLRGEPLRSAWIAPMSTNALLAAACLTLIGVYLVGALLQVTNNYLTISIGQRMVNDLRARLFEHLQRLSLSFHRRREIGDLLVRITYDTFSIQTIAMNGLFPIVSSGVLLAGMFAVMVKIDPTLTAIALAIVPMLLLLISLLSGRIERLASSARAKESRLQNVAHR